MQLDQSLTFNHDDVFRYVATIFTITLIKFTIRVYYPHTVLINTLLHYPMDKIGHWTFHWLIYIEAMVEHLLKF